MRPALSQIKLLIKPLAVGGDRTSALGVKFLSDVPPRLSLAEGDVLLHGRERQCLRAVEIAALCCFTKVQRCHRRVHLRAQVVWNRPLR